MEFFTLGRQSEFLEKFSSLEGFYRQKHLYDIYVQNTGDGPLSSNEKSELIALARTTLAVIRPATAFLERCEELIQVAQGVTDEGFEKSYSEFLASDRYSPLLKERFRERVEQSGGIRKFAEGYPSRAKVALANAQDRLQLDLKRIEQGKGPDRTNLATPGDEVSDDSLFEGGAGIAGVGAGLLGVAAGVAALATAPVWIVGGLAFGGGMLIGFGFAAMATALGD